MKNKRKYIRHPENQPVEFVVKDTCYSGTILDLSSGGAFIVCQGSFSIGDTVTVIYQSNAAGPWEMERTGTITRISEKGIGIEFKRLGDSDYKHQQQKGGIHRKGEQLY
ncbi:hypothetical protein LCGC14_1820390 [marine sediment metagenome]|uniref:PilZ domain-containing protein n=1 Tax=marine sediment metagenome TaxID=412755 RepID=A0A0F9GJ99_9ZZZZ